MIPKLEDYKILYMHQMYWALTPYDLFTMPSSLKICGTGHNSLSEAKIYIQRLFDNDMKEYERLQKMGRSFPDND